MLDIRNNQHLTSVIRDACFDAGFLKRTNLVSLRPIALSLKQAPSKLAINTKGYFLTKLAFLIKFK